MRAVVGLAVASLVAVACGGDDEAGTDTTEPAGGPATSTAESSGEGEGGELEPVRLQLQWFTQGQFAGFFAADSLGFYEEQGIDIEILEGGVDIVPQTVLAQGEADFAIAWVPKALASREQGAAITNVAQVFQRSGTLQVAFAESGIDTPEELAGANVGNWGFGNEFELFAGMTEAGLDPGADVTLVQQQFDMVALLNGEIDAAQAMTYNEYAQVLEAVNPETGQLYTEEDFTVIDWNDAGTAMLQDAVWASTERLESDPAYEDLTVRFLTATFQGWIHCRDNPEECRDIVVAAGSQLGDSHQLWQVNEVNKLIWPSPNGIGIVDQAAWDQTVEIARNATNAEGATVLTAEPEGVAFTNEYAEQALEALGDVDTTGDGFEPIEVTLEEAGA
ncbi:MAG: ABC transporter substrate-binding protein [Acidimicrobiia bacterium]|nr:ABC transporter substrate-binding protein [Acidimicrobiia bacterium]